MKSRPKLERQVCLLCFAASSVAWIGCGGPYDSYASGVATLDGSPLPRGTVSYNPAQPGPVSYGVIRSDGSYLIKTGREEGLPSGEYTVTVVAKEESIPDESNRGLPPRPGKTITPPWYSSNKNSPLKFTVQSGSNDINLELTSEAPPDWKPPASGVAERHGKECLFLTCRRILRNRSPGNWQSLRTHFAMNSIPTTSRETLGCRCHGVVSWCAMIAVGVAAASHSALAEDSSAPALLQMFEAKWNTIADRQVDLFYTGYGAMWLPPPGRADSGDQSVGYDVYDRFDLGRARRETLYGTEASLKSLVDSAHAANVKVYTDLILNHAGFSDLGTVDDYGTADPNDDVTFAESGGYPGLAITLPGDIDGDFHGAFEGGDLNGRLAGLVDIAQEKNHPFIRQPIARAIPIIFPPAPRQRLAGWRMSPMQPTPGSTPTKLWAARSSTLIRAPVSF